MISPDTVSDEHLMKIISNARLYEKDFSGKNFLIICSSDCLAYHISFKPGNFMHLAGVQSKFKPEEFYDTCLSDDAFELLKGNTFYKRDRLSHELRTTHVEQKNKVLPDALRMFTGDFDIYLAENIRGASFDCVFGTGNIPSKHSFVMGFKKTGKNGIFHAPNTLLKAKISKYGRPMKVDFVFSKSCDSRKYDNLAVGDSRAIESLFLSMPKLEYLVDIVAVRNNINERS